MNYKIRDILKSLKTWVNPRSNFKLNTPEAKNWYITVREIGWFNVTPTKNTDLINDHALKMINDRSNLEQNDILFSWTGTIWKVTLIKEKPLNWNIKEWVYSLKPNTNLSDPNYLAYTLKYYTKLNVFQKISVGSTVFSVPMEKLLDVSINVPALKDQQKIASVLSTLDIKIELNNKINTELEAIAKILYNYWFVQFNFPDKNGKTYKSSGGEMLWNEELKRDIPKGWKNGTLNDIAELVRGVSYNSTEIKTKNDEYVIPILRATNISGNIIDLNNMVYVPKINVSHSQILNKYDILITMSSGSKDHIGKNSFFYYDEEVSFGAFCAKIVAKDQFRFYLYSFTQSDFMFNTIKNECLGTNINNLNGTLVKNFKIVIPPTEIIELFNKKIHSVYEKIGNNTKENKDLTQLRDFLLPMLMNGQVSVA